MVTGGIYSHHRTQVSKHDLRPVPLDTDTQRRRLEKTAGAEMPEWRQLTPAKRN